VVKLSSTFFEEQQRHPMIATMSSMLEQQVCRYPVKGIGSPILYDFFEDALNSLTEQGFARMPFEVEHEWILFICQAYQCVGQALSGTVPFDFIQGSLLCIFARTDT
jgi:hypothetical protein